MGRGRVVVVLCTCVGWLGLCGSAAAASWGITPSPNPLTLAGGLAGVSCPNPGACVAVGSYTGQAGLNVPLAQRWNGHGWVTDPVPAPSGLTRAS